jgi:hypothetical protein
LLRPANDNNSAHFSIPPMPHSLVATDDTYLMYNDSLSNKSHQHQQQQQQQQQQPSNNNNRLGKSSSENLKYRHNIFIYNLFR